jgi:hypothetical protein
MTPFHDMVRYHHFGAPCCLHLQGEDQEIVQTFQFLYVWLAATSLPSVCLDLLRVIKRMVTVERSRLKGKGTMSVVDFLFIAYLPKLCQIKMLNTIA